MLSSSCSVRCAQVRKNYERDMIDSDMRKRQMGTALYFIDKLALRAGHEKDEDEAETVGCCTLKVGGQAAEQLEFRLNRCLQGARGPLLHAPGGWAGLAAVMSHNL